MLKYEITFKRSNGERKHVAFVEAEPDTARKEVVRIINEFCDERRFNIPYLRIWNKSDETWFDVGSWTEFFVVSPELPWGGGEE